MRSDELSLLVPPRQEFGYDLIDFVGRARYLHDKQREEIQTELRERGVQLSTGTISALCDRFLAHLERLHVLRSPALRAALSQGYALHIDATCDKGKGGHLLCIDGITGWMLQAARIDSESGDALAPVVQRTVELFGDPVAVMRDMGKGGAAAVHSLRERGVTDLICHQHFLRAVGNRLLGKPYGRLRTLLKGLALRSELIALRKKLKPYKDEVGPDGEFGPGRVRENLQALVHWLIQGDGKVTPSFPFALPHLQLVLRCESLGETADTWMPRPWKPAERRAMGRLRARVDKLKKDPRIGLAVAELKEGWRVFSELRGVLRLTRSELPGSSRGGRQLPIATAEMLRLHEIEMSVRQYEQELEERAGAEADPRPSSCATCAGTTTSSSDTRPSATKTAASSPWSSAPTTSSSTASVARSSNSESGSAGPSSVGISSNSRPRRCSSRTSGTHATSRSSAARCRTCQLLSPGSTEVRWLRSSSPEITGTRTSTGWSETCSGGSRRWRMPVDCRLRAPESRPMQRPSDAVVWLG